MTRVLLLTHNAIDINSAELYRLIGVSEAIDLTVAVPRQNPGIPVSGDGFRLETARLVNPDNYLEGFVPTDLSALLKTARPDIIQCMSEAFSPYVLQMAWLTLRHARKAKVLFYAYENMPWGNSRRTRLKMMAAWDRLAGGEAASRGALEALRSAGFPDNKPVRIVPYGIGTRTFYPMDREAAKAEFGFSGVKLVGYIGRLVEEKGIKTLLAAISDVENVHCIIAGRGPLDPDVKLWGGQPLLQGRVHQAVGYEPVTLGRLMNAMDIFVLPSVRTDHWMEQYGRVLVEAMACGTPVIGSDSGAIPEVIGDAGAVVPEYEWQALTNEIRRLVDDPAHWQEMSKRAITRASQLSDTAMSAAPVQFFRELQAQG